MKTKEIMHKRVVTVSPEMTLKELADLLIRRRISGAPVVDRQGNLVGVVSQTDLVRHEHEAAPPAVDIYHIEPDRSKIQRGFHVEDPDSARVKDVMTPKVIAFEENIPVREIAKLMLQKHVHRVVITREGRVCGIVTTMDMLKILLDFTARWEEEVIAA